jgi:hypothetical protein
MKPKDGSARKGRSAPPIWNSRLPMEWMDPMSWRLPSGQALAEFALQAGFLAPLIMGVPGVRKRPPTRRVTNGAPPVELPVVEKEWREGPGASGTFHETR